VYVYGGTFAMSGGAVSGNFADSSSNINSSHGGGVSVDSSGTFNMSGGTVSGNSASSSATTGPAAVSGGGVYVYGIFAMSGGKVYGNVLSGTITYGKEVLVYSGTFRMSEEAWPERVFLRSDTQFITINGPLSSSPVTSIDLGITSSAPLTSYVDAPILKLDSAYPGNMAELKSFFVLGNSKMTATPYTEGPITGYEISDEGLFVEE
jgi:hypothetical protein